MEPKKEPDTNINQDVFYFQLSEAIPPLVAIPLDIQPHLEAVELFHKVHSLDPLGRGARMSTHAVEREDGRDEAVQESVPFSQIESQNKRGLFQLRQEMIIQSLHSYNLAVIRPDRMETKQRRARQLFEFESWWLFQTGLVYDFSFESCCDYVGVSPGRIRGSMRKLEKMYRVSPKMGLRAVKLLIGRDSSSDSDSDLDLDLGSDESEKLGAERVT